MLCPPVQLLTVVNEIFQSKAHCRPSTLAFKAPLWRKPKPPQRWWMDIINVVHLFTFYSAIWENEGSTANGKCAYFGTPVPERHPFDVHGFRGGQGDSCLTSPKPWSLVSKLNLKRIEDFWIFFSVYSAFRRNETEHLQAGRRRTYQNAVLLSGHTSISPKPCALLPRFACLAAVYL